MVVVWESSKKDSDAEALSRAFDMILGREWDNTKWQDGDLDRLNNPNNDNGATR